MRLCLKISLLLLCITGLHSCRSLDFDPYDYDKGEDAKLNVKAFDCSFKIRGKKFYLKRELQVPEYYRYQNFTTKDDETHKDCIEQKIQIYNDPLVRSAKDS